MVPSDRMFWGFCCLPYHGHPKGCPNYGKRDTCPPAAAWIWDVISVYDAVYAAWYAFPLGEHVEKMRAKHPDWSERQLRNCLYWQGTSRKRLKEVIDDFMFENAERDDWVVLLIPEAHGVNVTKMMRPLGVILEWPPMEYAYKVAVIGRKAYMGVGGDTDEE